MKKHWKKLITFVVILKKISNQESFYENQALMLNTLFLVDEIFTGNIKLIKYRINDDKFKLFESRCNQKESETVTQQSKEQPGTTDMSDLRNDTEEINQEKDYKF